VEPPGVLCATTCVAKNNVSINGDTYISVPARPLMSRQFGPTKPQSSVLQCQIQSFLLCIILPQRPATVAIRHGKRLWSLALSSRCRKPAPYCRRQTRSRVHRHVRETMLAPIAALKDCFVRALCRRECWRCNVTLAKQRLDSPFVHYRLSVDCLTERQFILSRPFRTFNVTH
jgi:hypothetical protein